MGRENVKKHPKNKQNLLSLPPPPPPPLHLKAMKKHWTHLEAILENLQASTCSSSSWACVATQFEMVLIRTSQGEFYTFETHAITTHVQIIHFEYLLRSQCCV